MRYLRYCTVHYAIVHSCGNRITEQYIGRVISDVLYTCCTIKLPPEVYRRCQNHPTLCNTRKINGRKEMGSYTYHNIKRYSWILCTVITLDTVNCLRYGIRRSYGEEVEFSGCGLHVTLKIDTNISKEHNVSIFRAESSPTLYFEKKTCYFHFQGRIFLYPVIL